MAKKTVSEKIVEYIALKGYYETISKSRKYRTFIKKDVQSKLFVGKRGALRSGLTSSKSRSIFGTVTHKMIDKMLKEAVA